MVAQQCAGPHCPVPGNRGAGNGIAGAQERARGEAALPAWVFPFGGCGAPLLGPYLALLLPRGLPGSELALDHMQVNLLPQSGGAPPAYLSQPPHSSLQHRDTPSRLGSMPCMLARLGVWPPPPSPPLQLQNVITCISALLLCCVILPASKLAPSSPCPQTAVL